MKIGIVGAGIMGRLLAWQLTQQGHNITLFERDKIQRRNSNGHAAAYTAAGMLTPISEADDADEIIVSLGQHALDLWPSIVEDLKADVGFHQNGSLILAHNSDQAELLNFRQHVARFDITREKIQQYDKARLGAINHELGNRFNGASYIPNEAWISPQRVMSALAEKLQQYGAELIEHVHVNTVEAGRVASETKQWQFDQVIDCRGLGAKTEIKNLRGVRGEVIWLYAPEVDIQHLVRLMHPRYRIYIVPRANNIFVIGATQIESAHQQPITVRSALELLSAAYSVHSGFAEANIIETRVNCRPALPDNLPKIYQHDGLMQINGLFRHGFLIAPALAEAAIAIIQGTSVENMAGQSVVVTRDKSYPPEKPKATQIENA